LNADALPAWDGLNVFDVIYDANGGSNPPSAVTAIGDDGITIKGPESMSRGGYAFKEWNTSQNGSGSTYNPNNYLTVRGNTTLYAIWNAFTETPTLYSYEEDVNTNDLYNISVAQKTNESYEYHYGQDQSDVNNYDGVGMSISNCSNGYCNFTVDTYGNQTYVKVRAINNDTGHKSAWSSAVLINPDGRNQVFNNIFKFFGIKKVNAQDIEIEQPEDGTNLGGQGNNNVSYTDTCRGWWCEILDGSSRTVSTTFTVIAEEQAPDILVK
jgi:hypothetical protein